METLHPFRDESLDAHINRALPGSPLSELATDDALREVARGARLEAAQDGKGRRGSRLAAAGVALVLVLGGAGAAAATTDYEWPWWADQADASLEITLPSGVTCGYLIGALGGAESDVIDAARDILTDASVPTRAQVDEQLVAIHGQTLAETPPSLRDDRYSLAALSVITHQMGAELEKRGFDPSALPESSGVITCPGVAE